ncbi:hypothetical protein BR93DRAFT_994653 [Coniochaeta sp. PMI_546]|nr:hypothetical protein BR93DRAFT_994653 [Coniochaeta sp. PMI_546]
MSSSSSTSRPNRFTRPPRPPRPPPQPAAAAASSSSSTPIAITPPSPSLPPPRTAETVGSLLATIAESLTSALRLFALADKSHWGPDEAAQVLALRRVLSAAGRDFEVLSALVGGGTYLEHDARGETLAELRGLARRFEEHGGLFREWVRMGGPVNPLWVRETVGLGRELRRAMCRAAGRVWWGGREGSEEPGRCLGGEVVGRALRRERERRREGARWEEEEEGRLKGGDGRGRERRGSLEAVVPECNSVGRFERLGEEDVAFVCDYCDGFLVWGNLAEVPAGRRVEGATVEGYPNWAAAGRRRRVEEGEEEEKVVVYAPLAIANHVPPKHGEWMSRVICPYCEEYTYIDAGDDGDGERRWVTDQGGFETVEAFQEHLQWTHTALPKPALPFVSDAKCAVM